MLLVHLVLVLVVVLVLVLLDTTSEEPQRGNIETLSGSLVSPWAPRFNFPFQC